MPANINHATSFVPVHAGLHKKKDAMTNFPGTEMEQLFLEKDNVSDAGKHLFNNSQY